MTAQAQEQNRLKQGKRVAIGIRASLVGMITNGLLALLKILAGGWSGSVAVTADGMNNLSDMGSSLTSLLSIKLSGKPGDPHHPFGHGRIEYIGALIVGLMVLMIGFDLLKNSFISIFHPVPLDYSVLVLLMTAVSVPVKLLLWLFYRKWGTHEGIPALLAAATDSRNDVLITASVLTGLLIFRFLRVQVDAYLGVVISVLVLKSGYEIIKDKIDTLLGTRPNTELSRNIMAIIKEYPEILDVHDFVLHDYGPGRSMASLHAEVDANANFVEIHEVIDQAERRISEELDIPICIHMDPSLQDDEQGCGVHKQIRGYLKNYTPEMKMHDFRIVPGQKVVKLIFDVAVPAGYADTERMVADLESFVKSIDSRYECLVRIDLDYMTEEKPLLPN